MTNEIATVEQRIEPAIRAALEAHIGAAECDLLSPWERAMRLASLSPAEHRAIHKRGEEQVHAALNAPHYHAPTPEELAAATKLEQDCEFARTDFKAYCRQRDAEAQERIRIAQERKGF